MSSKRSVLGAPATTFLDDFLVTRDLIAGPKLSRREESDVDFGWEIAQKIAALDIGQTVIAKNGTILAVEGFEGTNETIRRGGVLGGRGAVMIKVAKPNQDMRFDVPVIGVETISIGAEARIRVIALEAGRTLLLEKDEVILAAERARITVSAASYKSCQVHWLRRNRRAISFKSFSMGFRRAGLQHSMYPKTVQFCRAAVSMILLTLHCIVRSTLTGG